ncbi:MAG: transporter associated domain-containing protein, partial [Phycisphaerales bacterium]
SIDNARRNKHTRYPVCNGSMDEVLGVIHIKDLFRKPEGELLDLRQVMRKPSFVPETVSAGKLLGHFRASRQHLAFVIDEYGSVVGIVTLENVLERIVGAVQDEFDTETPDIKHEEKDSFIISGSAQIDAVNRATGLALSNESVDTLAGLLMERLGRVVHEGEIVQLDAATAEVIEVRNSLATSVRLRILNQKTAE